MVILRTGVGPRDFADRTYRTGRRDRNGVDFFSGHGSERRLSHYTLSRFEIRSENKIILSYWKFFWEKIARTVYREAVEMNRV